MVGGGEGAGVGDEQPTVYHLMVFHTISGIWRNIESA